MLNNSICSDLASVDVTHAQPAIKVPLTSQLGANLTHHQKLSLSDFSQRLETHFFNEMMDDPNLPIETLNKIEHWLNTHSLLELQGLNAAAEAHFLEQGISFNVYAEGGSGIDRCIPFDVIPRVIAQKQWEKISAGCAQRTKALNCFLHDIYHDREILKANIISESVVLSHPAYLPLMLNHDIKGGVYSQISGVDLVRDSSGEFYVLEDNLRTPSGMSYMMESRKISEKLLPDLCCKQIQTIEDFPLKLKSILSECALVDQPFMVVLSPGRFNSAYYEHAFLAREMGIHLVTSQDLYVYQNKVFAKVIGKAQQVDVIYRRLDDAFLDPLCFKPDSMLGVAGLMSAYLQGNVVIANAPGTGVADDKSIYPYVDKMINFYLNEQPILKNIPTYDCREADHLDYVLAHLDELVVKEAQGSGGYGMLIGPHASAKELHMFKAKLLAAPEQYIAQPTLALSISPTLTENGIEERHVDLRPFVLSSPHRTEVMPGGLTRVAMQKGSLVVNSSQGGGVKDTWVVDPNII